MDTLRIQKKAPVTGAARKQECENTVCMGGEKNGVLCRWLLVELSANELSLYCKSNHAYEWN